MANVETKVITPKPCRWSFAHLMEPYAFKKEDTPKYSVRLLIPKDTEDGKAIIAAITSKVKQMLTDPKVTAKIGTNPKLALKFIHDGDETDLERYPEQANCYYINVSNTRPVDVRQVIDGRMTQVTDPTDIYSGCYGLVSFNMFAYSNEGKGIGCSLNNAVKTADGEAFGGTASTAEDDFAGMFPDDGAPAGADADMNALLNM